MSKSKYYYAIVWKENGIMITEDRKLPFYWNRKVAKKRAVEFSDKTCVVKMSLDEIKEAVLTSEII